ncbi:MAG: stalk domain-containing protein [Bacillota bacterium]|nr:stalk domain-containing protein [Bacillota bacterium]
MKMVNRIFCFILTFIMLAINFNVFAASPNDVITFKDPNLEKVIRESIYKPTEDIIRSDIDKIITLDATNKGITNLEGIENFTGLTQLYLSGNSITDVTPLGKLTNLNELMLCDNQLKDITPLANLKNLTMLSLLSNKITNISPLKNLSKLTSLHLEGNPIKDYSPVSGFYKNLTDKDFDINRGGNIDSAVEQNTSSVNSIDVLRSDIAYTNQIYKKYHDSLNKGYKPKNSSDANGNIIERYNYAGVVLDTVNFKNKDGSWVTIAANKYGEPEIVARGEIIDGTGIREAYAQILDGTYDFKSNKENIEMIYLSNMDLKSMDVNSFKKVFINPDIAQEEVEKILTEALSKSYGFISTVIGYANTQDQSDGNSVYTCLAITYPSGIWYSENDHIFETKVNSTNTPAPASALGQQTATPKPVSDSGNIVVTINGTKVEFDVEPQIVNGRTLVPMRKIFEALGAVVQWDSKTKTVTGKKGDRTIILIINKKDANVNGVAKQLDVPATIINGRTLVPVRFISESLGCKVQWDLNTKTVVIVN